MKGKMYISEAEAWADLTPQERFEEYASLFSFYRMAGGSLGPDHDSQSPFNFDEYFHSA